jgi:hypothetical protein
MALSGSTKRVPWQQVASVIGTSMRRRFLNALNLVSAGSAGDRHDVRSNQLDTSPDLE